MEPKITTINGAEYSIGKLDAFKQFHVARRLAPLLATVGAAIKAKESGGGSGTSVGFFELISGPFATVLASMKDEDVEYVLRTCLSVCKRKQGNGAAFAWAPVQASNGAMMFSDLEMADMVGLAFNVIEENLGSFFTSPQPISQNQTE